MRISDWSSDVCSSDLPLRIFPARPPELGQTGDSLGARLAAWPALIDSPRGFSTEIEESMETATVERPATEVATGSKTIARPEERRVRKECVKSCSSGRAPAHSKKITKTIHVVQ